jgi:hypothetical protein
LSHKNTLSDTNLGSQDIPSPLALAEGLFIFLLVPYKFYHSIKILNNTIIQSQPSFLFQ